jgi:hypothetical protein
MSRKTVELDEPLLVANELNYANRIIFRLQNDNESLTQRLKEVQSLCESQSYEIGYMKAALSKTNQ